MAAAAKSFYFYPILYNTIIINRNASKKSAGESRPLKESLKSLKNIQKPVDIYFEILYNTFLHPLNGGQQRTLKIKQ